MALGLRRAMGQDSASNYIAVAALAHDGRARQVEVSIQCSPYTDSNNATIVPVFGIVIVCYLCSWPPAIKLFRKDCPY